MKISSIERQLGLETFASETQGIGGVMRYVPEDFLVEETLVDGSKAELEPNISVREQPLTGQGRYLICLLVKHDWDTLLVARKIAKQLGISERRVRFAGIKDKKAVTSQYISIENVRLKHLKRIRIGGIRVHPFRYSPNMVFPHMLYGNMFHLTIRNISHSAKVIQERVFSTIEELRKLGGVPNFFGHQRFGTIRPITHLVGKALALNDAEKAAMLFLARPSLHESPKSREAREELLKTRNHKEALNRFPRKLLYERLMLYHLSKHQGDYRGAFRKLPRRLCILFLQAYQSYLFNRFLSQRMILKTPLDEPQIGDYVVGTDSQGLPTDTFEKTTSGNQESLSAAVRRGDMYVALPLIGFRQASSEGIQGDIEKRILLEEKVSQDDFLVPSMPEIRASGRLRAALTPLKRLNLQKPVKDELSQNKMKVEVCFFLHRGSYATVLLREIMKPRNLINAGF